MTDYLFLYTSI